MPAPWPPRPSTWAAPFPKGPSGPSWPRCSPPSPGGWTTVTPAPKRSDCDSSWPRRSNSRSPKRRAARIVEDLLGGRRKGANRLERQALAQLAAVHANDARRWNAGAVAELAQQLVDTDNLAVADPTDVRLWARAMTTLARAGRVAPAATLARQAQAGAMARGEESAFLELTSVLAYVYLLQGSLELAEEECRRVRSAEATRRTQPSHPGSRRRRNGLEPSWPRSSRNAVAGKRRVASSRFARSHAPSRASPCSSSGASCASKPAARRPGCRISAKPDRRARQWEIDNPAVSNWRALLAGALHRTGATSEAWELAQERLGRPRLRRRLVAGWRTAGGCHRRTTGGTAHAPRRGGGGPGASGATLELAHALVELGESLAQGDEKEAAREVLRRGADAAFRCSATPLVSRAVRLLRSTGARPRRVALTGTGALTPMERRAAELALAGHGNAEIAQILFVNAKTVEAHLSRVYRKLRIRSRRQLPSSLARVKDEEIELEPTGSHGRP